MKDGVCMSLCDMDSCNTGQVCDHVNTANCDYDDHHAYYSSNTIEMLDVLYDRVCIPFAAWKIAVIVICCLLFFLAIAGLIFMHKKRTGVFKMPRV